MKIKTKNDKYVAELVNDVNYYVSPEGRVETRITTTGKVSIKNIWRQAGYISYGYNTVTYGGKKLRVSRIVYLKYLSGIKNLPVLTPQLMVGHLDGNILNDSITNLFAAPQAGINLRRFTRKPPVMGNTKLTWILVKTLRLAKKHGSTHKQLAEQFNISKGHVSEIVNNKIWIEGKEYARSKNVRRMGGEECETFKREFKSEFTCTE